MRPFYELNPEWTHPKRIHQERLKARELKKTTWWLETIKSGICHYCEGRFEPSALTMDHAVPLARGGQSTKANLVPACLSCNQSKKLETPVDRLLKSLQSSTVTTQGDSNSA